MGEVNTATPIQEQQHAEVTGSGKGEGKLKAGGKEHAFQALPDSESISEGASKFLQEMNEPAKPEQLPNLEARAFTHIPSENVNLHEDIQQMMHDLDHLPDQEGRTPEKSESKDQRPLKQQSAKNGQSEGQKPEFYPSLFSLARSFNQKMAQSKKGTSEPKSQQRTAGREESRSHMPMGQMNANVREMFQPKSEKPWDQQHQEEREGQGERHQQNQDQDQQKKKQQPIVSKIDRSASRAQTSRPSGERGEILGDIESIFVRFMALMARILGQAEAEAHALYLRIKERTDNIDVLTLLIQRINNEQGEIDWSENEEMKQILDRAREMGVEIPEGKLKWSEEEKKLLKENIQMRKDSMEKVTQLERTDMQRYLQEASQCHQARSNILKLLKEVMDTIIHNMRP